MLLKNLFKKKTLYFNKIVFYNKKLYKIFYFNFHEEISFSLKNISNRNFEDKNGRERFNTKILYFKIKTYIFIKQLKNYLALSLCIIFFFFFLFLYFLFLNKKLRTLCLLSIDFYYLHFISLLKDHFLTFVNIFIILIAN